MKNLAHSASFESLDKNAPSNSGTKHLDGDFRRPAKSTIHAVLCRHGLVKPLNPPRRRAAGTPLSQGGAPNDLWCADFKGEFKLGDRRYCYPLTVTDHASRCLLLCEALESTREDPAITAFEQLFKERGLPSAIRSDNGVPFASPNGLFNLSKLSVWRLRSASPSNGSSPAIPRKRINVSTVLAGQRLGIKEVDEGIWIVSFMSYDLGFIDLEQKTLQPLDNPFGPRMSPMS